jgi:rhamnosyltransferase subunit B
MGSAGDVHPFIGLGKALMNRGHEVRLFAAPSFKTAATAQGLDFHAMGTEEDFERIRNHPHLWNPRLSMPFLIKEALNPSYEPILAATKEFHAPGETVILASSLAFGTLAVGELLKAPVATVHLAPSLFPSVYRQPEFHSMPFGQRAPLGLKRLQWWVARRGFDWLALPAYNRFRTRHGLQKVRNLLGDSWNSKDRVIGLFPPWFAAPQPDWPEQTRLTGFPLFDEQGAREIPDELKAFLEAGEAPVIFTPGSAMAQGHRFFAEAVKSLKRLDRRGILLTPYAESVPRDLPGSVRHFSYIPFSEVLPHAAALVYHGGIGTCSQALRAGIPQLIQPMAYDQFDTLSRVRDLGVGMGLEPPRFKAARIAEALQELLDDPSYRRRARDLAELFEPEKWLRETCEWVEALFTEHETRLLPS